MANQQDLPVYTASRTANLGSTGFPSIDTWQAIVGVSLRLHDGSGAPALGTVAKLCYDDACLYVQFECEDTEIQATMFDRDDPIFDEEVVEIFLDPNSDELTYYEFEFSPRNVVFDAMVENPSGSKGIIDTSWDCRGLRTEINHADGGNWTELIAIPFAALSGAPNIPPKPGDRWRMNLYRIERAPKEEYSCFSPTLAEPANYHVPARFGTLKFD